MVEQLMRGYERKRISPRCMIKLDLRKACDSVNWDFLRSMLVGLGFPDLVVRWIMECVTSVSYTVSVNGVTKGFFPGMRRLRQGDPLSPYHFVICMEYLSRLLHVRAMEQELNFHPMCHVHKLTHLIFADDLMLFSRGDVASVRTLATTVLEFGRASGLLVNNLKSNLFLAGVHVADRTSIEEEFRFATGTFPFRYLGIPLAASKLRVLNYQPLLDKIEHAIGVWKGHTLSYAGRLEILKAVVQGTCCYWLSIFSIPITVIGYIEDMARDFLWDTAKPKVSWEYLCKPKADGGLGLRCFRTWNRSLLGKDLWDIHLKKDSLWIQWVNEFYLKGTAVWE
ncbi:PREDICTED: uncharacterized protein LOC105973179 [Erythranthe guttata]|uniref:uncharacterized protein LOC105973179 n=1 Tax=Erythranthe guttata TaxID=4155 RepID=UPI00064D9AAA|nr:PREDICTED: uncharacterized protein LOC105973179 [Erythranthe guttata]|eukprot:XP_012853654.1 PREDICTED: uncharacterized protein LOC105973179 [Erythranthe guttata]